MVRKDKNTHHCFVDKTTIRQAAEGAFGSKKDQTNRTLRSRLMRMRLLMDSVEEKLKNRAARKDI